MAEVGAFLAKAGRTPFVYGGFDCCLWLADWLVALGYPDPAAHLRGRYATAMGCARILNRNGGVLGVVSDCAARAGLWPTLTPKADDVGVILVETAKGLEQVGAICTGPRWSVLSPRGLLSLTTQPLSAWSV